MLLLVRTGYPGQLFDVQFEQFGRAIVHGLCFFFAIFCHFPISFMRPCQSDISGTPAWTNPSTSDEESRKQAACQRRPRMNRPLRRSLVAQVVATSRSIATSRSNSAGRPPKRRMLYLDFINLFLILLRVFGDRRQETEHPSTSARG